MDNFYQFFKNISSRFRVKRQDNRNPEACDIHPSDACIEDVLERNMKETGNRNILKSRKESETKSSKDGQSYSTEMQQKIQKNRQSIPGDDTKRLQSKFHTKSFPGESKRMVKDKSLKHPDGFSRNPHAKAIRKRHAALNDGSQSRKIMKTETSSDNGNSVSETSEVSGTSDISKVTGHHNCPSQTRKVFGEKKTGNIRKYDPDNDAGSIHYMNIQTSKMPGNEYLSNTFNNKPVNFGTVSTGSNHMRSTGCIKIEKSALKEDSISRICTSSDETIAPTANNTSEVDNSCEQMNYCPLQNSVITVKKEMKIEERDVPVLAQKSENYNCKTNQGCLKPQDESAFECSKKSPADSTPMHFIDLSIEDIKIILDNLKNDKIVVKEEPFDGAASSEGSDSTSCRKNCYEQTNYSPSQNLTVSREKQIDEQRICCPDKDTENQRHNNSEINIKISITDDSKPASMSTTESSTNTNPTQSTIFCKGGSETKSENNLQYQKTAFKTESVNELSLSQANEINEKNNCFSPSVITKTEKAIGGQEVPSVIQNTESTNYINTDCSTISGGECETSMSESSVSSTTIYFTNAGKESSPNRSSDYLEDFNSTSTDESKMTCSTYLSHEKSFRSSKSGESDVELEVDCSRNIGILKYMSLNTSLADIEELYKKICKDKQNNKLHYFHRENVDKRNSTNRSSPSDLQSSHTDSCVILSPNKPIML